MVQRPQDNGQASKTQATDTGKAKGKDKAPETSKAKNKGKEPESGSTKGKQREEQAPPPKSRQKRRSEPTNPTEKTTKRTRKQKPKEGKLSHAIRPRACTLSNCSSLEPQPAYNPAAGPYREDRPGDSPEFPLNEALVEFMGDTDELEPGGKCLILSATFV
jgi:hypothetical protein